MDVDGDCGGDNLQWAWSSVYAAAMALADALPSLRSEFYS
ncbi:NAD(P)/FAD-dependent oxidoreductase [Paenibacillus sp.]|nr:NAD(P)/FAD-dependent oxidoreductase [Paenibacillus sp.]